MPLGYPDKLKGAPSGDLGGNEKAGAIPDSKVFARGPFDAADELDVALSRHHSQIVNFLSNGGSQSKTQAQLQERASANATQHSSVILGLLHGLLCDSSARSRHLGLLRAVTRDGHAALISTLHKLCQDKWTKLKQDSKESLLWLVEQLLFDLDVGDAEVSLLCIVRQMASGDLSDTNVWLASQILSVLNSHKPAVYSRPNLLANTLFSYLRLLADHFPSTRANIRALAAQEVAFCVSVLRERFQDCLVLGRDLIRILQDVSKVPELQDVWQDLLSRPESFGVPHFTDIRQLYNTRTPTRFIASRVTPEMEQQLRFLLTHVQMGEQRRYQTWFALKHLSSPESESLVSDLIRFICCVIHPTNQILQSNIMPRWAVIGWLLKCCRSCHVESNAKLSLLYDWLFYSPQTDNIMNIEPAILCIFYSLPKYAELSNSLLEFLFLLLDHYDEARQEVLLQGIKTSVGILVSKGVVPHLHLLSESPQIPLHLRERVQVLFPSHCRVKPSAATREAVRQRVVKAESVEVVKQQAESLTSSKDEGKGVGDDKGEERGHEEPEEGERSEEEGEAWPIRGEEGEMPLKGSSVVKLKQERSPTSSLTEEETEETEFEREEEEEGAVGRNIIVKSEEEGRDGASGHEAESTKVGKEEEEEGEEERGEEEGSEEEDRESFSEEGEHGVLGEGAYVGSREDQSILLKTRAVVSWGKHHHSSFAQDLDPALKKRRFGMEREVVLREKCSFREQSQELYQRLEGIRAQGERQETLQLQNGTREKQKKAMQQEREEASRVSEEMLAMFEGFLEEVLDMSVLATGGGSGEGPGLEGGSEEDGGLAGALEDAGPPKRRRTGDLHGCKADTRLGRRESDSGRRNLPGEMSELESQEEKDEMEGMMLQELADFLLDTALEFGIPLCKLPVGSSQESSIAKRGSGNWSGEGDDQGFESKKVSRSESGKEEAPGSLLSVLVGKYRQGSSKHRQRVVHVLSRWHTQGLEIRPWVLWLACLNARTQDRDKLGSGEHRNSTSSSGVQNSPGGGSTVSEDSSMGAGDSPVQGSAASVSLPQDASPQEQRQPEPRPAGQSKASKGPDGRKARESREGDTFQLYHELLLAAESAASSADGRTWVGSGESQGKGQARGESGDGKGGSDRGKSSPAAKKRKRVRSLEALTATSSNSNSSDGLSEGGLVHEGRTVPDVPALSPRANEEQEKLLSHVIADVEVCFLRAPESPATVVPTVLRQFPQICTGSPRLLHLLVGTLEPEALAGLEMLLSAFPFPLMGRAPEALHFKRLIGGSQGWDWAEQEWLWRLVTAAEAVQWPESSWVALLQAAKDFARVQHTGEQAASTDIRGAAGNDFARESRDAVTRDEHRGEQAASTGTRVTQARLSPFFLAGVRLALQVAPPSPALGQMVLALPHEVFGHLPSAVVHHWAVKDFGKVLKVLQAGSVEVERQVAQDLVRSLRASIGGLPEASLESKRREGEALIAILEKLC